MIYEERGYKATMKAKVDLPQPTAKLVASYTRRFDRDQRVVEQALAKLFRVFARNSVFDEVLLKVVVLNDLYRTNIFVSSPRK